MLKEAAKKKITLLSILSLIALAMIGGKLTFITIGQNRKLNALANELWERSFPLVAPRGLIEDRDGNALAINQPCFSVAVIPYQIEDKALAAHQLAPILKVEEASLYQKISKKASIVRLHPEGKRISEEQAKSLNELNIPGVYLVQDNARYYPYETSMASLLGFVGIDNQGLAGVENYYDSYLKGKDGSLNYLMDAKGGLFPSTSSRVEAPVPGLTLRLTLSLPLQNLLEREMENAWLQYSPKEIIGIMMDPNTGEILAIGNRPTYNNNYYNDYDPSIYNRSLPVFSSFEPGSTFKSLSFAAALNEHVIDMDKDYYYDKGYEIVGGATIKSWKKGGHGLQTFLEVLQNSSNPGFVEIARRLGKDNLYQYINAFGMGQKTGIDIAGENKGIVFAYDKFGPLEQATSAFGQGISVTAIQLVTAFSSLINGGYLYTPRIAKSLILESTNETVYEFPTILKREVIKKETSALMRRALECVVSKGSGRKAYIDGYRVGGKTGTAQIAENGVYQDGRYILSFIAGAPMHDPKVVVYFAMREPKSTIQYGGTTIGPIIQRLLLEALPILNVEKNYDGEERTYTWMDVKTYPVENYYGLQKKDVKSKHFKFSFMGEGDYVIDQLPRVGEMVEENSVIMIMLGDKR